MSVRRLAALVNGLPLDSALVRSVDPYRTGRGWDVKTELLAVLCEQVDAGNRLFIMANSRKGSTAPKPIRIPRPQPPQAPRPTQAALASFFAKRGIPVFAPKQKD